VPHGAAGSGAAAAAAAAGDGGMSTGEVAAALGVSRQRADQLLGRAAAKLRSRLGAAAGAGAELRVLLEALEGGVVDGTWSRV
jgi:hypothetical protein